MDYRLIGKKDWIQFVIFINWKKIATIGNTRYDENTNSAELDNLAKHLDNKYPGFLNIVEKVHLKWMFDVFQLAKIIEKLFSDNYKALNPHFKCGFKITDVIPTKRKFVNDGWIWQNISLDFDKESGEKYYHIVELSKKNLMKNFGNIKFQILKNE